MEWRWEHGSWVGRGELPGDFYDLAVTGGDGWDDAPPDEAVARVTAANPQLLLPAAVQAACAAREKALGWRSGPPLDQWSLIEVRVTEAGALWVTVHEYETDEYSLWMVRFDDGHRPAEVLRRAWVPVDGDPVEAGTMVG